MVIGVPGEKVPVIAQLGHKQHIVADKGEKHRALRFAHPQGLPDALLPVGGASEVVQGAEHQHRVKGAVGPPGQVQGVALHQLDAVLRTQLLPESADVGVRQLQGGHPAALPGKVQAVFARTRAHIQNAGPGPQVLLDIPAVGQKLYPGGGGAVQPGVLVEKVIGPVDLLRLVLDGAQLLKGHKHPPPHGPRARPGACRKIPSAAR